MTRVSVRLRSAETSLRLLVNTRMAQVGIDAFDEEIAHEMSHLLCVFVDLLDRQAESLRQD